MGPDTVEKNIAELDAEEIELQKMAAAVDSGEDYQPPEGGGADDQPGNRAPGEGGEGGAQKPDADGKKEERKAGGTEDPPDGSESKKTGDDTDDKKGEQDKDKKTGDEPGDKSKESEYEKARQRKEKDKERLNKSWQDLDKEKESVRTLESDLKKREAELDEREKKLKEPNYTAEDFDSVAEKLEADGKAELAKRAKAKAEALRKGKGEKLVQTLEEKQQAEKQFVETWNGHFEELKKEHPDLADTESELGKKVTATLKEIPALSYTPDGIVQAVKLAELKQKAESSDKLLEELEASKAEIKRLNELISIDGGSPPGGSGGPNSFDEMTLAEQEAELKRNAAELDGAA